MGEPGGIFEPFDRWGLLPDRPRGASLAPRAVLRHWFVHFNPLYLLSALCILAGVLLVNRSLDRLPADALDGPRLALFAVTQAYEALVVVGAAFLARRARAVRPAALLVLLEALFLFDGTLRLESQALRAPLGCGVTLLWLAAVPLKVWGLAAALRVPLTRAHYARIVGGAAALASIVHLLAQPAADELSVLQAAAWLGAVVIGLLDVRARPPVSALAVTVEEHRRGARCVRGAFRILTAAYFFHVWSYLLFAARMDFVWPAVAAQLGTLFLRAALTSRRDAQVCGACALLVCAALPNPAAVPYALLVAAGAFAYRAWREGRGRLATGAALFTYAALWIRGWPGWGEALPAPVFQSWPTLGLAIALALISWRMQDRLAGALAAAGGAYAAAIACRRLVPHGELPRGVALLAAGFVLFIAGLAANWWLRAPDSRARSV